MTLTPNETMSLLVLLRNYGPTSNFSIVVSDDKSFVASYSPRNIRVEKNDSVDIQINFFAHGNTTDSTTSSVSVSASLRSTSTVDLANFISFEASVFSKVYTYLLFISIIKKFLNSISAYLTVNFCFKIVSSLSLFT